MNRTLRPLVALFPLAFSGLVAACGEADPPTPRAEAMAAGPFCQEAMSRVNDFMAAAREAHPVPEGDEYGGTAVAAGITELVQGMNSFRAVDVNQRQHQQYVNLMTLVQVDEALEPIPWLAESWEVSEDGTALTFRLRDDVLWHDGEPTTSPSPTSGRRIRPRPTRTARSSAPTSRARKGWRWWTPSR